MGLDRETFVARDRNQTILIGVEINREFPSCLIDPNTSCLIIGTRFPYAKTTLLLNRYLDTAIDILRNPGKAIIALLWSTKTKRKSRIFDSPSKPQQLKFACKFKKKVEW